MLRSIGYQGSPIDGLPYDATTGTVPNARARIVDESGEPITGTYVTGWIKRGPRRVKSTRCSPRGYAGRLRGDVGSRLTGTTGCQYRARKN